MILINSDSIKLANLSFQVSSSVNTIAMFSHTKDWSTSPVRFLAWHPHCNKLAVATRDDTVLVYTGSTSVPVVVRHSSQKDISSLAWRYFCAVFWTNCVWSLLFIQNK